MQSGNAEDSPYAHAYIDGLLDLMESRRSGGMEPDEMFEQIMIGMVSFQQFLDMRLTLLERKQDPPVTWQSTPRRFYRFPPSAAGMKRTWTV